MPALWSGPLPELREQYRRGTLEETFIATCREHFGEPSPSEMRSWVQSLPQVLNYLDDPSFDPLQAVVELQMPVGAERADLVLVGGAGDRPSCYLLELKQWSDAHLDTESCQVDVLGFGLHQHPVAQVLNYQGKLAMFNDRAADYGFTSGAYLHNLGAQGIAQLMRECAEALPRTVELFGVKDGAVLADSVAQYLLPAACDVNEHHRLTSAEYTQSAMLFDLLTKHAEGIASRAVASLAEAGVYLMEDQELLVEQVLKAARRGKDEVFLVEGGPGSGKTLVAVHLLLRAIKENMRCVLAIRNNRLQAILRRCFDIAFPGASGLLMYFEVPQHGTGIGDAAFKGKFDLVICDEAQRMRQPSMETILSRAPTSVIFLDETQRLNPREQGTIYNFSAAAGSAGKVVSSARLPAGLRCRGGQPYHDFVDGLLLEPSQLAEASDAPWQKHYQFEISPTIDSLLRRLVRIRQQDPTKKVALVAAFTESPGSMASVGSPENLRVGFPLSSGWDYYRDQGVELRWLMKPSEYVSFWMRGKSNELDRTSSIYGAQGFEADYVGIIWGRDFVVRNGEWSLGDPSVCFDTIDGLVDRRRGKAPKWSSEAFDLVKNRYRIFLTRGIHGSCVFFEDAATRHFARAGL